MHRTGKYKMINLVFGLFPFIGGLLITFIHEDSGPWQSWLSIVISRVCFLSHHSDVLSLDPAWFWKCSGVTNDA